MSFQHNKNEVQEHEEVQPKRPCLVTPFQPTASVLHDPAEVPRTSDPQSVSKDGNNHASSLFSDDTIKCANNLFTSKYHQYDFCKDADCCNVTKNEEEKDCKTDLQIPA